MRLLTNRFRDAAIPPLLFAFLTVVYCGATGDSIRSSLASDLGDPLLNLYLLHWVGEHAAEWLGDLWSAPFFHPSEGAVARSDHLLGPALAARVLRATGFDDRAAYNLLFLAAFVTAAWAMQFVTRRFGLGLGGSTIAGLVFAFLPFRWSHESHLQILLSAPIPLAILAFDRLLEDPSRRRSLVFVGSYVLLLSCGLYLAYMTHLALAVVAWERLRPAAQSGVGASERKPWDRAQWTPLLVAALVCCASGVLVFGPYLYWSRRFDIAQGLFEALRYSPTLLAFLSVEGRVSPFYPELLSRGFRPECALFPGFAATLLAAVGIAARARSQAVGAPRPISDSGWRPALALALFGLGVAALVSADLRTLDVLEGTARPSHSAYGHRLASFLLGVGGWALLERRRLGRWPLVSRFPDRHDRLFLWIGTASALACLPIVWATFAKIVPGLDSMRAYGRLFTLTSIGIAWFAGRGFERLTAAPRAKTLPGAVAVVLVLLLLTESRPHVPWAPLESLDETPDVLLRLAERDDAGPIAHFPAWNDARETRYMYWSLAHGLSIANGYSGTIPEVKHSWSGFSRMLLPPDETLDRLCDLGVREVVVHVVAEPRKRRRRMVNWLSNAEARGLRRLATSDGLVALELAFCPDSRSVEPRPVAKSESGGPETG